MNKKNVVFILADDMGAWCMGCAGNHEVYTPNLDALAQSGRRFTDFHCASPVCSPARASIMTGQIPSWHGVHDWLHSGNIDKEILVKKGWFDPQSMYAKEDRAISYLENQLCFTDVLKAQGYQLALSGKWHLGNSMKAQHGFDHWYTMVRGACDYMNADIVEDDDIHLGEGYVTDLFTDKALEFLEEMSQKPKPFFLALHYNAPHSPWEAACHLEEDLARYRDCPFTSVPKLEDHPLATVPKVGTGQKRRENLQGYFSAVTAMDRNIGRIMEYLAEESLLEDTIVFFMGDNGMNMGHHGLWGKGNASYPVNMYEESIKVPFIARVPEETSTGKSISHMLSQLDFFPTLMDLLDIKEHGYQGPGRSFASLLGDSPTCDTVEELHDDVFICEEYGPARMLKTRRYKLIVRNFPEKSENESEEKAFHSDNEFYDLSEDPEETQNFLQEERYRPIIQDMYKRLDDWFRKYVDPAHDGSKEEVKGSGQIDRVGPYRSKEKSFM